MKKYLLNRKLGQCTCDNCGVNFEKPISEITRNEKLKRKNFCCRSCNGHSQKENLLKYQLCYDISKHSNNLRDKYTGLRSFLIRIKRRSYEYDIDLDYLKELWDKQNICV